AAAVIVGADDLVVVLKDDCPLR
ncbi:MAG: hypothetical protein QOH95_2394, partial [Gaiellaceae bacterium]|nr:hypothetical protein [Gaiellaceae bacterium]